MPKFIYVEMSLTGPNVLVDPDFTLLCVFVLVRLRISFWAIQ